MPAAELDVSADHFGFAIFAGYSSMTALQFNSKGISLHPG
jgi:hypothetical protein